MSDPFAFSGVNRSFRTAVLLVTLAIGVTFLLSACGAGAGSSSGVPSGTSAPISYSRDVVPILQSRCLNCHGGQQTSRGLDMNTYASLITGSQNGPVIVPGNAAGSLLIQMIQQGKMPKRGPGLLPAQVKILVDWIQAGAPDN
jgi:hypothetical protein